MKKLFTLYDSKSETYTAPQLHKTRNEALRSFAGAVNAGDKGGVIAAHPADFTLFEIGTWDEENCTLVAIDKIAVANGIDVVEQAPLPLKAA